MEIADVDAGHEEPCAPRTRKLAVGQHTNGMLFDTNGNTRTVPPLDSVSEIMSNIPKDENDNPQRNSRLWENAVLQQIQTLIENVQVSETLAEYINKEILSNVDINANGGCRQRRKSCFTLNNNLHSQPSRRQSVTSLYQNKSKSLPRTINTNEPEDILQSCSRRRNSVVNNSRRPRNTWVDLHRRSSVTIQSAGRRSSVAQSEAHFIDQNSKMTSLCRRRSSLAHAYQRSAMPTLRRVSVTNENINYLTTGTIPQRRRSSVKPPCFPVTKVSNVQKRLHKIYNRRRRRHDRREVNIADVRKAFKGLTKGDCADTSEDDPIGSPDDSNVTNRDSVEVSDADIIPNAVETSPAFTSDLESVQKIDSDTDGLDDKVTETSTPKRKTSIQVRAWELSRRIRQRRRQKRKGFTESELI